MSSNSYEKNYAVVQSKLFFSESVAYDVIFATTNLFNRSLDGTYFIPIVPIDDLDSLNRVQLYKSHKLSSSFVFSRSNDNFSLFKTDDFGYFNNSVIYLSTFLEDLALQGNDLSFIDSLAKKYSR